MPRTLKEIRKAKGISAKFVYNLLGISRQTLYNKETGKTKFSALETQKLCNLFGVDISEVKL